MRIPSSVFAVGALRPGACSGGCVGAHGERTEQGRARRSRHGERTEQAVPGVHDMVNGQNRAVFDVHDKAAYAPEAMIQYVSPGLVVQRGLGEDRG